MGKPVLVSDKVTADMIFGLQVGAAEVVESQAPEVRSYEINDKENLARGFRGEGVFNLDLLGYSWAIHASTPAPANPNVAQLGTAANWTKHAQSDKATAGVIIDLTAQSS